MWLKGTSITMQRNIQLYSQVFIPFQQCITNVVTCDYQIGQRNISCRRVNQNIGFLTCDSCFFQTFHVTHVYSTIRTAVDVVAFSCCNVQHIDSTFSCADTCCVCFGVNHSDTHCYAEFGRSYGCGPTNKVASCFSFLLRPGQLCSDSSLTIVLLSCLVLNSF